MRLRGLSGARDEFDEKWLGDLLVHA